MAMKPRGQILHIFTLLMDDPAWEKLDWKTYGRGAAFGMSKKSKRKTRRKPD